MKGAKQIIYNKQNSDLLFLSPYSRIFRAGSDRYLYYREDLHHYVQLCVSEEYQKKFIDYLTKGIEYSKLIELLNEFGADNSSEIISRLIGGGIVE